MAADKYEHEALEIIKRAVAKSDVPEIRADLLLTLAEEIRAALAAPTLLQRAQEAEGRERALREALERIASDESYLAQTRAAVEIIARAALAAPAPEAPRRLYAEVASSVRDIARRIGPASFQESIRLDLDALADRYEYWSASPPAPEADAAGEVKGFTENRIAEILREVDYRNWTAAELAAKLYCRLT